MRKLFIVVAFISSFLTVSAQGFDFTNGGFSKNFTDMVTSDFTLVDTIIAGTEPYGYYLVKIAESNLEETLTINGSNVSFSYEDSDVGRLAFKAYDTYIQPNGPNRTMTISGLSPGDEIKLYTKLYMHNGDLEVTGATSSTITLSEYMDDTTTLIATDTEISIVNIVSKYQLTKLTINGVANINSSDISFFIDNGIKYLLRESDSSATVISNDYSGDLTIPNSISYNGNDYLVLSIESSAFSGCTGLTSINISEGITTIGDYAFNKCTSLSSVNIPSSVTSIGEYVFSGCDSLISVSIPSSVTSIGEGAFFECTSLSSVIIPSSITSIEGSVFSGCTSLTSVDIPSSVTSIGEGAFTNCDSLTSVIIPEGVTSIGDFAFLGCDSLALVSIPSSVTSIGEEVFVSCYSLTTLTVLNPIPVKISSSVFLEESLSACTFYVPYGSGDMYGSTDVWKEFNIVELPALTELTEEFSSEGEIFEWQAYEDAAGYKITIYSDEEHTDTLRVLEFNASGVLTKDSLLRSTSTSFSYTITGLDSDTEYFYTFETLGMNGGLLEIQSDSFTTLLGNATKVSNVIIDRPEITAYYSITGTELPEEPEKGIYVVQYSDGTSEKMMK